MGLRPSVAAHARVLAAPGEAMGLGEHRSYTVSLWRPFSRRALITRRPPLVDIRARKPCVRLRGMRFGCQVLFINAKYPVLLVPQPSSIAAICHQRSAVSSS